MGENGKSQGSESPSPVGQKIIEIISSSKPQTEADLDREFEQLKGLSGRQSPPGPSPSSPVAPADHEKLAKQFESSLKALQKPQPASVPLYKLEELHMQEMQSRTAMTQNDPNRYETQDHRGFDDVMHWSKSDEQLPGFYKGLNLPPEMQKFNVGNKLGSQLISSISKRRDFERSFKRGVGSYVYQSIKRGRLGVDLYFLIFAMFGTLCIPYYYYQKGRPLKELVQKKRKIIDDVMEKAESSKYDIDDISLHENYNTLYKKEIEDYKVAKFKVKKEIRKLEKDLYKDVD